jgi:hypothetical protein
VAAPLIRVWGIRFSEQNFYFTSIYMLTRDRKNEGKFFLLTKVSISGSPVLILLCCLMRNSALVAEHCFDRYGEKFCKRFAEILEIHYANFRYVDAKDVWERQQRPCDGNNPYIAFRVCRKYCGFCDFAQVKYTIHNAQEACRLTD